MSKYRVYLEATASVAVDVEADSEDEAIDLALENAPTPASNWPDMGEWNFPGDIATPPGVPPRRQSDFIEVLD